MGEVGAEGSRDMVGYPKGRGRPRARTRDGAVVYPKAGTEVCAKTEDRTATRVCKRAEVEVRTRMEITTVGMFTERDEVRNREAAKIIAADAQGMRDSRRNVD
ncbi:uncharacterized protein H6S33_008811 [Morchella sextelata]|uniref:uncharacterized protein n=1 Tax=Morchella sextelata TaxID=1174677 RepID=UPI001D0560CE|nr:uncharacterized protein H6S33_008811 [Morchella sextelata]KAH0602472.1 hypothetical protein H6S33_008811 [Morchella sextelata]